MDSATFSKRMARRRWYESLDTATRVPARGLSIDHAGVFFGLAIVKPLLHPTAEKQTIGFGLTLRYHLLIKHKYQLSFGGSGYFGKLKEPVERAGPLIWTKNRKTVMASLDLGFERLWPLTHKWRAGAGFDLSFLVFAPSVSDAERTSGLPYRKGFYGYGIRLRPFIDRQIIDAASPHRPSKIPSVYWAQTARNILLRFEPVMGLYILENEYGKQSFCLNMLAQLSIGI